MASLPFSARAVPQTCLFTCYGRLEGVVCLPSPRTTQDLGGTYVRGPVGVRLHAPSIAANYNLQPYSSGPMFWFQTASALGMDLTVPSRLGIARTRDRADRPLSIANATITYRGGPVISNVRIVMILYGAGTCNPHVDGTARPNMHVAGGVFFVRAETGDGVATREFVPSNDAVLSLGWTRDDLVVSGEDRDG